MKLRDRVLSWSRSYLRGRCYVVSSGDHKSELITMTSRISPGSSLRELSFCYVNMQMMLCFTLLLHQVSLDLISAKSKKIADAIKIWYSYSI